ncbi:MAG: uncharacterized protein QOF16_197 [Actinomycetota bacterium]|jgi:uncharacterized protein (DUF1684 family)|nr:uncharacterized protein [Actinomycetota bacterium]
MTTELELLDWKRTIFELYADVRASIDPRAAWDRWRSVRDELFRAHPQSPLPDAQRGSFKGLRYFEYDPEFRVTARVEQADPAHYEISTSGDSAYAFTRFAIARFELLGESRHLEAYWLDGYGGGLFLPFRDTTAGSQTYGAGRYMLDTVKGSDLGGTDGELVLDFNFSYNPSCAYDPRWVCPLAPPPNRLSLDIRAGERHES